jgi:hypothetical protein
MLANALALKTSPGKGRLKSHLGSSLFKSLWATNLAHHDLPSGKLHDERG